LKPTSIEVDVFPVVAAAKQLFALELPGFWMDIGQPRDYLRGNHLYLNALRTSAPKDLASSEQHKGVTIVGNVLIVSLAGVCVKVPL
jgi:mannose-1-phosphate guanylyltransferase